MDIVEAIIAIRNNPGVVSSFISAVSRLFDHLIVSHGVFRGTHEVVLVEAQGAEVLDSAGNVFNHMDSLRQSRAALVNREQEIQRGLTFFARFSNTLSFKIREIVRPIVTRSESMRALMDETETKALELARTNGTRLQGVRIGAGGLGPEVARSEASLVSAQLEAQAVQLRARGIEPTILPNAAQASSYLARVRALAVNNKDSAAKMFPVLTAMRVAAQQALRQASIAGRALLSTVLDGLLIALEAVAARIGTTLTTPILIPTEILESLGGGSRTVA